MLKYSKMDGSSAIYGAHKQLPAISNAACNELVHGKPILHKPEIRKAGFFFFKGCSRLCNLAKKARTSRLYGEKIKIVYVR